MNAAPRKSLLWVHRENLLAVRSCVHDACDIIRGFRPSCKGRGCLLQIRGHR
jgi:hypothetical protein